MIDFIQQHGEAIASIIGGLLLLASPRIRTLVKDLLRKILGKNDVK